MGGSRTPDTRIFSPLLYQLSYQAVALRTGRAPCPAFRKWQGIYGQSGAMGIEPPTRFPSENASVYSEQRTCMNIVSMDECSYFCSYYGRRFSTASLSVLVRCISRTRRQPAEGIDEDSSQRGNRRGALSFATDLEKTAEKARSGILIEAQARQKISEMVEHAIGVPLAFETAQSGFKTWLAGKVATKAKGTAVRYEQIARDFLAHLGPRARLNLAALGAPGIPWTPP